MDGEGSPNSLTDAVHLRKAGLGNSQPKLSFNITRNLAESSAKSIPPTLSEPARSVTDGDTSPYRFMTLKTTEIGNAVAMQVRPLFALRKARVLIPNRSRIRTLATTCHLPLLPLLLCERERKRIWNLEKQA